MKIIVKEVAALSEKKNIFASVVAWEFVLALLIVLVGHILVLRWAVRHPGPGTVPTKRAISIEFIANPQPALAKNPILKKALPTPVTTTGKAHHFHRGTSIRPGVTHLTAPSIGLSPNSPGSNPVMPDAATYKKMDLFPMGKFVAGLPSRPQKPSVLPQDPWSSPSENTPLNKYPLSSDGKGGFIYHDSNKNFDARISPDGTIRFHNHSNFHVPWENGVVGNTHSDWAITFDPTASMDKNHYATQQLRFENDPQVRKVVKQLQEQWKKHMAEERELQLERIKQQLEEIWQQKKPAAQRRKLLFELWLNCDAEDEAAKQARRSIIQYIQKNLPADHPDGYTAEELQRWRLEGFAPY